MYGNFSRRDAASSLSQLLMNTSQPFSTRRILDHLNRFIKSIVMFAVFQCSISFTSSTCVDCTLRHWAHNKHCNSAQRLKNAFLIIVNHCFNHLYTQSQRVYIGLGIKNLSYSELKKKNWNEWKSKLCSWCSVLLILLDFCIMNYGQIKTMAK